MNKTCSNWYNMSMKYQKLWIRWRRIIHQPCKVRVICVYWSCVGWKFLAPKLKWSLYLLNKKNRFLSYNFFGRKSYIFSMMYTTTCKFSIWSALYAKLQENKKCVKQISIVNGAHSQISKKNKILSFCVTQITFDFGLLIMYSCTYTVD